jgi:hypothetical protein
MCQAAKPEPFMKSPLRETQLRVDANLSGPHVTVDNPALGITAGR